MTTTPPKTNRTGDINLNFIRCFEVLAETLSFSLASERLRLAQSNVSRQIKILEESLGVRLFHRTRQGVSLTPEGARFKQEVLPLTLELREKLEGFMNRQQEEAGEIKLGCFAEVGKTFFMPLCLDFQKQYPKVALEMVYESESAILSMITKSEIEFGIVANPPIIEGLAAFPVMKQKIGLFGPASAPKNPSKDDIEAAPYAAYEKTDALLAELWSKQISKRRKPQIVAVVNSHASMLDAVATNGCFAVLPLMSARASVAAGLVRQIPGYEFEIPLYFVHPQSEWMPRKNQAFKQFILKRCKQHREGEGREASRD
jgi:DNA-binding transcriptional LysR family regulator